MSVFFDRGQGNVATYFVYDESGQLLGEYDQSGNMIREYIWLGNRIVGMYSKDVPNTLLRVHTDHLGTPRAVSQGDGATVQVLWRFEGDAFGDVQPTNPTATPFTMPIRMPGQYYDTEVGINYNYFRDYDSSTGRYVESDPIGLKGGLNTYGYVGGSPLRWVDPDGLHPLLYMILLALDLDALTQGEPGGITGGLLKKKAKQEVKQCAEEVAKSTGAESVNASQALASKLSALEDAQATAARVRTLTDGRIRYYEAERAARTSGPSRGSSYATEWNPANGNVRSWNEVYDQAGKINRIHPKMINGQTASSLHYPPTAKELGR